MKSCLIMMAVLAAFVATILPLIDAQCCPKKEVDNKIYVYKVNNINLQVEHLTTQQRKDFM